MSRTGRASWRPTLPGPIRRVRSGWQSIRHAARSRKHLAGLTVSVPLACEAHHAGLILAASPGGWFPRTIGVHLVGIPIRKGVRLQIVTAVRTVTWASVRFKLSATFPRSLFPTMHGSLTVSAVDGGASQLSVKAVYRPPLGAFGEFLNELLLHWIAARTIRELAEAVARRIEHSPDASRHLEGPAPPCR